MKKLNLRNSYALKVCLLAAILTCGITKHSMASGVPTIVSPVATDNWFENPAGSAVNHLNNAFYMSNLGMVMGAVWDDGSNTYFTVSDGTSWISNVMINVPAGYNITYMGDITIGESPYSSQKVYVGVTYLAQNTTSGATDVFMDVYAIAPPSVPMFIIYGVQANIPLTTSGAADPASSPHIDGITEVDGAGNNSHCSAFVTCWSELSSSGSVDDVMGCAGDLETFYIWGYSPIGTINMTGGSGYYNHPDVAGIQRTPTAAGTSIYWGLFAYTDNSGNLFYQEWQDVTTTTTSAPSWDDVNVLIPRIDAIDPWTSNSASGIAHYDIAYISVVSGTSYLNSYTDATTCPTVVGVNDDATYSGWTSGYPTVAFQGRTPNYWEYNITFANRAPSTASNQVPYSQGIFGWSGCLISPNWALVPSFASFNYGADQHAVAQMNNFPVPAATLVNYYDPGSATIYYKMNFTTAPSYKSGNNAPVDIAAENSWIVAPNPATNNFVLSTKGDITGKEYQVVDMAGRTIVSGKIENAETTVDVSKLAAGLYMVNIMEKDSKLQSIKLAKE